VSRNGAPNVTETVDVARGMISPAAGSGRKWPGNQRDSTG
jgi:hypothetical protein